MRSGAPLQRCNVVANVRVHPVVGSEVFFSKVLDTLYYGLQADHARW
jgi:hypothetical protein